MTIHKVLKASSEKHKQFDTILQLRNKMKTIKNRCKNWRNRDRYKTEQV